MGGGGRMITEQLFNELLDRVARDGAQGCEARAGCSRYAGESLSFIPAYVRVASVEPEEKTVAVLVRNESRNQEPEAVRSRSKRSDAETRPNEVPKG